jgi:hypothetical protein
MMVVVGSFLGSILPFNHLSSTLIPSLLGGKVSLTKDFYSFGRNISAQCTEVRFASFLSGGFTIIAVINPPERKLAKRTSVQ